MFFSAQIALMLYEIVKRCLNGWLQRSPLFAA